MGKARKAAEEALKRATESRRIVWEKTGFSSPYRAVLDGGRGGIVGISAEERDIDEPVQHSAFFAVESGKILEFIEETPGDEHLLKDLFTFVRQWVERLDSLLDESLQWVESEK